MFSTAQIVGIAVFTLVVIAVAFILTRIDDSIGTLPVAEEAESDPTVAVAAIGAPPMPAGAKKLPRSKRKARS